MNEYLGMLWAADRTPIGRRCPVIPFPFPLFTFCCLLCLFVGCTGEYERRLAGGGGKSKARTAEKFNVLQAPRTLPGTSVSIRLPRSFTSPPLEEGAADARRVKSGTVTIPGLKLTYEGFVSDKEEGQLPFYCYVGVADGSMKNIAAQVRNSLAAQPQPGGAPDWTDFQSDTADGRGNQWRKLRFTGDQEFYYKKADGQEQFLSMPGLLEVYLHEKNGQVVIVVWRMPANLEQYVGLAKLAPLVAGSVSVRQ